MPKYDLIEEDIKWCKAHRNPEQETYQDGFIAGLEHALFLMKSRSERGFSTCPECGALGYSHKPSCSQFGSYTTTNDKVK